MDMRALKPISQQCCEITPNGVQQVSRLPNYALGGVITFTLHNRPASRKYLLSAAIALQLFSSCMP